MGLIDKFMKTLIRRTPVERQHETHVPRRSEMVHHVHSNTGTKAERRTRRKIAHESRRVNFQKAK